MGRQQMAPRRSTVPTLNVTRGLVAYEEKTKMANISSKQSGAHNSGAKVNDNHWATLQKSEGTRHEPVRLKERVIMKFSKSLAIYSCSISINN